MKLSSAPALLAVAVAASTAAAGEDVAARHGRSAVRRLAKAGKSKKSDDRTTPEPEDCSYLHGLWTATQNVTRISSTSDAPDNITFVVGMEDFGLEISVTTVGNTLIATNYFPSDDNSEVLNADLLGFWRPGCTFQLVSESSPTSIVGMKYDDDHLWIEVGRVGPNRAAAYTGIYAKYDGPGNPFE